MTKKSFGLKRNQQRIVAVGTSALLMLAGCGGTSTAADEQSQAPATEVAAVETVPTTPALASPTEAPSDAVVADAATEADTDDATVANDPSPQPAAETAQPPTAVPPTDVPEPAAVDEATVSLPAIDVVNLISGETASLASLAQPGATLLWFWAPH